MSRKVKFIDEAGVEQEITLRADIVRMIDSDVRLTDDDGVFFQRQLEAIEAKSYDVLYPDLEGRLRFKTNTFGGAGVVNIPNLQKLLRYICENAFEHHVAANFSSSAAAVTEAATKYLGWDMHVHE